MFSDFLTPDGQIDRTAVLNRATAWARIEAPRDHIPFRTALARRLKATWQDARSQRSFAVREAAERAALEAEARVLAAKGKHAVDAYSLSCLDLPVSERGNAEFNRRQHLCAVAMRFVGEA